MMKKQLLTIAILLLSILAGNLYAQNSKLSVQGVLRNSNGTAVENGDYRITFKLWDEPSGGNLIWHEVRDTVRVEGGIYSIVLGAKNKVLDAPFDEPYYLGVSIGSGTELIPRSSLTSSPYALSLIGSDNVFPNSGNVGVGDENPQSKLTVKRGSSILGLDAEENANRNVNIKAVAEGLKFNTDGINSAHIFSGFDGEKMRINTNGKVGIGTSDPQNVLHVKGENEQIKVEGTNNANIGFYKNASNPNQGASLGFDLSNANHLVLNNSIGQTLIKGNSIHLNPAVGITHLNSDANVNGKFNILENGEVLKLKGSNHTFLGFYPTNTNREAYVGFGADGINDFTIRNERTDGDLILEADGGKVKINDALHISGWDDVSIYYNIWRLAGGGVHNNSPGGNVRFDITAAQNIRAKGFFVASDKRIKKEISISNAKSDLAKLMDIEISDYRYIDPTNFGQQMKKGVIAQQVKTIFPEAISISKNYIPNLFTFPTLINKIGSQYQIRMDQAHGLVVGDRIKCMNKKENLEVLVTEILDDQTFAIDYSTTINDDVFFYGKEVSDFHTVDYDQIFTLCVSAVQELSNKVEILEKENTQLKVSAMKNDTAALQDEIQKLSSRMKVMESLFNSTSNN